jgi:plastocyanin
VSKRHLAAAAVLLSAGLAVACGSSYSSPTAATPGTGNTGANGGSTSAASMVIAVVGMDGANSFSPATASLKVGQTVAWTNNDSVTHDMRANDGSFDTGALAPGQTSAPITINTAGSIPYHCTIHPSMTGSLSVTQ